MRSKAKQNDLKIYTDKGADHFIRFVKKNLPVRSVKYLALLFGFLFSLSAFAVGDLLDCSGSNLQGYNENRKFVKRNPNNITMIYNLGIDALCLGKRKEGMHNIQKASDMGHVVATKIMGLYYRTNQTLDGPISTPQDLKNFNAMIYHYKMAKSQIESNPNYPNGTYKDIPHLEKVGYISAIVFVTLPYLYYQGYIRAIKNIMKSMDALYYEDTFELLNKMRISSEHCLRRPSLSVWKSKQQQINYEMKVQCSAMKAFAQSASVFETERINVYRKCSAPFNRCKNHKKMFKRLKQLVRPMLNALRSTDTIKV